ncbi:GHKL domain-containing protein [Pseudothauera nasutitermitis]|uniref:histidine kinase n=1 Tax=Pseudothauera nasutitermitis TaxID=2565930 RepID=A0A4S4B439_9RHOO|nr:PhnD/SsuA/transferrin family substrate-binding protein [Pseudothauera nasutitermitis]THF67409.1 GHKL domain-containing protein [Pseudothauera nasutitermitis]
MPAFRRSPLAAVLFCVLLAAGAWLAPARADDAVVRIGVLAFLSGDDTLQAWKPVREQLQRGLPAYRFEWLPLDHEGMRSRAARGELDFVITNPGHYVDLEAELGASRVLTLDSGEARPERAIGSAVVVPRTAEVPARLEELRGKRVALVSRDAFGGYQLLWRELLALGIDPDHAFAAWEVVGFPMTRVFDAVLDGQADFGIVRACLLESMPQYAERLRVLAPRDEPGFPCATTSRLYPDWPLATLRHTSPELAREVAVALLSMPRTAQGVSWAVPADYQSVHELFRELQIGPYAYLRAPTLMALAERYWQWVAALVMGIVVWVIYTVRVEHRVHVRTQELRAALEERQAIEARMRANQEQVDHLTRLSVLGELSGTLAHELNQPLATIGNYAQSVLRRADAGRLSEAASREAAGEIAEQAERAAAILARIRAFAKKRVGQRERRDPRAVVSEAVALFRGMLAQAPEVTLDDRLAPGMAVEMDALQIQQVVLNLLKNAYDACRDLGPERCSIRVGLSISAGVLRIAVRDQGPGLDPVIRARLFEPFLSTKADGLGLGLSICKTIAEAHGGRLEAREAADGPGMVFTLSIPAHD